jgi:hypothetical protein
LVAGVHNIADPAARDAGVQVRLAHPVVSTRQEQRSSLGMKGGCQTRMLMCVRVRVQSCKNVLSLAGVTTDAILPLDDILTANLNLGNLHRVRDLPLGRSLK